MKSGYSVEQVFLRRSGGSEVVDLVFVAPSGALKKERFAFPGATERQALERCARHLAARGDVDRAEDARLRVERGGRLVDDSALKAVFTQAFASARTWQLPGT